MLFERDAGGDRVILVHVNLTGHDEVADIQEFQELVRSAQAQALAVVVATRSTPDVRGFVGSGKLQEIQQVVADLDADAVVFNHTLSPSQQRNIEQAIQCRVLDRTGLILDIFAQRARSHEGKLQVELAQLDYQATRLVRGWTHLERQKGGIGLRGPGETQLETDRRLIRARMQQLRNRLARVRAQREQGRRSRRRNHCPTLALVGYTNAGKSTLFNQLTQAEVYAADQLFATLDPTFRQLSLAQIGQVIVADTVGFIRQLPHGLVEAFMSTLQETAHADLLLHVIDSLSVEHDQQIRQVEQVLQEIGAQHCPVLRVYNKIDGHAGGLAPRIDYDEHNRPQAVWVSALTGEGVAVLHQAIAQCLATDLVTQTWILQPEQSKLRALLYQHQGVLHEDYDDKGLMRLKICLPKTTLARIVHKGGEPVGMV